MKQKEKKNYVQLNSLQEFEFQETRVMAGNVRAGQMIALKPCVENLGLSWNGAFEKIKRDSELSQLYVLEKAYGSDGKSYEMACMNPMDFNKWMNHLDPSKYKKFNVELWIEYKDGLVPYLLMMLSKALNHIKESEPQRAHAEELRSLNNEWIKAKDTANRLASEKTEANKIVKQLEGKIQRLMETNPSQYQIDYK